MEALSRIDDIRRGTLKVTVEDATGNGLSGCHVNASMVAPAFAFGSAVNEPTWRGKTSKTGRDGGERYRREFRRLFDTAVFESDMKWTQWDEGATLDNHSATLSVVRELISSGIRVRGHNLVWPTCNTDGHVPGSVCSADIKRNDTAGRKALEQAIIDHISDEVTTLAAHGCKPAYACVLVCCCATILAESSDVMRMQAAQSLTLSMNPCAFFPVLSNVWQLDLMLILMDVITARISRSRIFLMATRVF